MSLLVGAALGIVPAAQAGFGVDQFTFTVDPADGQVAAQAGSHPGAVTTRLSFDTRLAPELGEIPDGAVKDLRVRLPKGLVGMPGATPRCSSADFVDVDRNTKLPSCADSSAVGAVSVKVFYEQGAPPRFLSAPVYNLDPSPEEVAKLGFVAGGIPVWISLKLDTKPPHGIAITLPNLSQVLPVFRADLTIWGVPASAEHDFERGSCISTSVSGGNGESEEEEEAIHTTGERCPTDSAKAPFLTMPRTCSSRFEAAFDATSWSPGEPLSMGHGVGVDGAGGGPIDRLIGCEKLGFAPSVSLNPTNGAVSSPTGLEFDLDLGDGGVTSPTGLARSDLERAVVDLPEGITINPSAATGLEACTKAQLDRESAGSSPGAGCPEASTIGKAILESPLLEAPLRGSLYIAQPDDPETVAPGAENPFDARLAFYVVLRSPERGIVIRQPARIAADPTTGRLTAFVDHLPPIPFSHLELRFHQGERAILTTPPACGSYQVDASLFPGARPGSGVRATSAFQITRGLFAQPCPKDPGSIPFMPRLRAGAISPIVAARSPFVLKVSREADSQPLAGFEIELPDGLSAQLTGIPTCSPASLATAAGRSGIREAVSPSCPRGSVVGSAQVGAGAGATPLELRSTVYLAGPYKGAPASLAIVTPALAGPFDLGTVVTRVALRVDRRTARIKAVSDPIPQILSGIPLNVRSLVLSLDRPAFTVNPTSCEASLITGTATSELGEASPLAARFKVGSCESLRFRPRLALQLTGSPRRGAHPRLRAVLRARGGEANLRRLAVTLPATELLAARNIRGVCNQEEFGPDACPADSVYGRARVATPLLDESLEGPVYLRAGDRRLPDLIIALKGRFRIDLVARLDAVRGRLRIVFPRLPDIPLRKFVLAMRGERRGLFVNSGGLCRETLRAVMSASGHNGMQRAARPAVRTECR